MIDYKKEHQDGLERDNPFRSALLKAGVVDKDKLKKVEEAEKKARDDAQAHQDWLEEEAAKQRKKERDAQRADLIPPELKEIYEKIDKMWVTKQKFVEHLIYSYIPLIHTPMIFEMIKDTNQRCAISGKPLLKSEDIIQLGFMDRIQTEALLAKNKDILTQDEQQAIADAHNRKMDKLRASGDMGMKAPQSTACLSAIALKTLMIYCQNRMFDSDFDHVGRKLGKIIMPLLARGFR